MSNDTCVFLSPYELGFYAELSRKNDIDIYLIWR